VDADWSKGKHETWSVSALQGTNASLSAYIKFRAEYKSETSGNIPFPTDIDA
jgi:hypothetical protein